MSGSERIAPGEDQRGWHIDRSISVPTIISILGLLFAGVAYAMAQNSRQTAAETAIVYLGATQKKLEEDRRDDRQAIKDQLNEIKAAVLRLEERKR